MGLSGREEDAPSSVAVIIAHGHLIKVNGSRFSTVLDYEVSHTYSKDPHAIPAPNRCQRALSTPLQPNHTINTINSNSWHPLGYIPSKYVPNRGFPKTFLVPMKFFHLGPHYIPKVYYICRTNYEILGQKVTKRQKVRSISQLFLHCVYIPETLETWHPSHSLLGLPLHGDL